MQGSVSWVLAAVLGVLWVQFAVLMHAGASKNCCSCLRTLEHNLNFSGRKTYLKHYLPINYKVPVHYEEVFRMSNISRLKKLNVKEQDLQKLWLFISKEVLKKILRMLPEQHPSWKYLTDLEKLFRMMEQSIPLQQMTDIPQDHSTEMVRNIHSKVKQPNPGKCVKPKALLDNSYRTMKCLFPDCFNGVFPCICANSSRGSKESDGHGGSGAAPAAPLTSPVR
ncbi:interleukin-34 isoform X2 [Amia ocellicauda]|uniref:interleukin-34 isoform X2 n=1 Tax=Amia ocellicauda TaxID=2972642 RepID=UPI0034644908